MVLPVSIDTQFRRLDKHLRELSRANSDEESIIVAEICNSCALLLDKTMNAVWSKKNKKPTGKLKPRIYFPVHDKPEKLLEKIKQYQMPDLNTEDPEIYELIESTQPYREVFWVRDLVEISRVRHERFPNIDRKVAGGIGFGRGQNLHNFTLQSDGLGNIRFSGTATERKSGKVQPLRIEDTRHTISNLEQTNENPQSFCESAVSKTKSLVSKFYRQLET